MISLRYQTFICILMIISTHRGFGQNWNEQTGKVMFQQQGISGVMLINDDGYVYHTDFEGRFSIKAKKLCLVYRHGYKTKIYDATNLNSVVLEKLPPDSLELIIRGQPIMTRVPRHRIHLRFHRDFSKFRARLYTEETDSDFEIDLSRLRTVDGFMLGEHSVRNDILFEKGNQVWIILDPHYRPIRKTISKNQLTITIEKNDLKPKELNLTIFVRDIRGPVSGYLKSDQFVYNGSSLGDIEVNEKGERQLTIDLPINDMIEVNFRDPERMLPPENEQLTTSVDSIQQTMLIQLPYDLAERIRQEKLKRKKKTRVDITVKVSDIKGEIDGFLESQELILEGAPVTDVEVRNGIYKQTIDRPKDNSLTLRFYNPQLQLAAFTLDTTVTYHMHPNSSEQHFAIHFPYSIEERMAKERQRLEEEARRKTEEAREREREAEFSRRRNRVTFTTTPTVILQYTYRDPQKNIAANVSRPLDNFESFPQLSTLFYLENVFSHKAHLITEISVPYVNGLGLGVSAMPVFNLVDGLNVGMNGYAGGAFSYHGSNLQDRHNGFWGGFAGVRIGFSRTLSKIDPGRIILDVRGSLHGIPFINNEKQYRVQTARALTFGVEWVVDKRIAGLPLRSVGIQYNLLDNTFERNLALALKFH